MRGRYIQACIQRNYESQLQRLHNVIVAEVCPNQSLSAAK